MAAPGSARRVKEVPGSESRRRRGGQKKVGGGKNAYEVLGLDKTASQEDIKKAYKRIAFIVHPDKNPDNLEDAKEKFQQLQRMYEILEDPERRKVYDRTGGRDESELFGYDFCSYVGREVTKERIRQEEEAYRGTAEEAADLKALYTKHQGKMTKVFKCLMASRTKEDSPRFKIILDQAILEGSVIEFPVYKTWAERVAQRQRTSEGAPLPRTTVGESNPETGESMASIDQDEAVRRANPQATPHKQGVWGSGSKRKRS